LLGVGAMTAIAAKRTDGFVARTTVKGDNGLSRSEK